MNHDAIANILGSLDRELWIVTAADGDDRGGLVATFVNPASIVEEMPRVLVGLAQGHHTCRLVHASGAFGLHLVSDEAVDWIWRFGLEHGHDTDKLAGLATRTAGSGAPILSDALGWLDCRVEARLDTGDRTIFLAEVLDGDVASTTPRLTMRRLLELAPLEKLEELRRQRERDAAIDAERIRAWRSRKQGPGDDCSSVS